MTRVGSKESVIETLLRLALLGWSTEGFRAFTQIPMVRLRRGRFWITSRRRRRAFFARHPYRFCLLLTGVGFLLGYFLFLFASCAVRI